MSAEPTVFRHLATQDDLGQAVLDQKRAAKRKQLAIQRERDRAFQDFLSHVKTYTQSMAAHTVPYVFISYAWEADRAANAALQTWLKTLATHLRALGLNVFLDTESMTGNFTQKMQTEVEQANWVLSICTPTLKRKITHQPQGNVAQELCHAIRKHTEAQRVSPNQASPWLPLLYTGSVEESVPAQIIQTLGEGAVLNLSQASLNVQEAPYRTLIVQLIPTLFSLSADDLTYAALCDLLKIEEAQLTHRQVQLEREGQAMPVPLGENERHQKRIAAFDGFLQTVNHWREKTQHYAQSALTRTPQLLIIAPPSSQAYEATPQKVAEGLRDHLQSVGIQVLDINEQTEKSRQQLAQQIAESDYVLLLCHPDFKQQALSRPNSMAAFTLNCLDKKDQENPEACLPILYQGTFRTAVPDVLSHSMARNTDGHPLRVGTQPYEALLKSLSDPIGLIPTLCGFRAGHRLYEALLKRLQIEGEHLDQGIDLRAMHAAQATEPPKRAAAEKEEKGHGLDEAGQMNVSIAIPYQALTLGELLGTGGFGNVHRGTWNRATVAIKQLNGVFTPRAIEELKQETAMMANLRSPYIVQLYGVCLEKGRYAMVMELMSRGSLYELLHNQQPLAWSTRYKIAMDITNGVYFLHQKRIIHRDLKSLNVLLDENLKAKISDFGLSTIKKESRSTTKVDKSVGTLAWMALELFKPRPQYSTASDIYALGMVFWELAAREIPWKDVADPILLPGFLRDGEQEEIPEDCPQWLADIIKSCWHQDPKARPTIEEIAHQLEAATAQEAQEMPEEDAEDMPYAAGVGNAALVQRMEQEKQAAIRQAEQSEKSHAVLKAQADQQVIQAAQALKERREIEAELAKARAEIAQAKREKAESEAALKAHQKKQEAEAQQAAEQAKKSQAAEAQRANEAADKAKAEQQKKAEEVAAKKAQAEQAEKQAKQKPSLASAAAGAGLMPAPRQAAEEKEAAPSANPRDISEITELLKWGKHPEIQAKLAKDPQLAASKELFLLFIAAGEQDQAETMLKANPSLAQARGTVTDLSGRTFEDITGFQYAVWALDWHMWKMIYNMESPERGYLSAEQAARQMAEIDGAPWAKKHGAHFSFDPLINALDTCVKHYRASRWDEGNAAWVQQVGGAQLWLPAHAINEYCRLDRSFDPTPNFLEVNLPRSMKLHGNQGFWFTAEYDGGKLGVKFGVHRSSSCGAVARRECGSAGQLVDVCGVAYWEYLPLGTVDIIDHRSACALVKARRQQLDVLVSNLKKYELPMGGVRR
jgi:hypothetical protein